MNHEFWAAYHRWFNAGFVDTVYSPEPDEHLCAAVAWKLSSITIAPEHGISSKCITGPCQFPKLWSEKGSLGQEGIFLWEETLCWMQVCSQFVRCFHIFLPTWQSSCLQSSVLVQDLGRSCRSQLWRHRAGSVCPARSTSRCCAAGPSLLVNEVLKTEKKAQPNSQALGSWYEQSPSSPAWAVVSYPTYGLLVLCSKSPIS